MPIYKSWEFIIAIVITIYYCIYSLTPSNYTSPDLQRRLKVLPQEFVVSQPELNGKLAYVQYATDMIYLKLALENFKSLDSPIGDLVLIYNEQLSRDSGFDSCRQIADIASIILKPVKLLTIEQKNIWHDSFTKLHIFNLIEYDRLVYFDADSMFINEVKNLNELFNIPDNIDIAMPQAYWLSSQQLKSGNTDSPKAPETSQILPSLLNSKHKFENRKSFFATHVIVLKPNSEIYQDLLKYLYNPWWWKITSRAKLRQSEDFDMEIINKYIDDNLHHGTLNFGIIDHRVYGVLTGEFKELYHSKFVSDPQDLPFIDHESNEKWNSSEVIKRVKLVHFSDEPIPKPWRPENNLDHYNTFKIYCKSGNLTLFDELYPINKPRLTDDCDSVEIWDWIRNQFRVTRSEILL